MSGVLDYNTAAKNLPEQELQDINCGNTVAAHIIPFSLGGFDDREVHVSPTTILLYLLTL